jgi:hypothetical protein
MSQDGPHEGPPMSISKKSLHFRMEVVLRLPKTDHQLIRYEKVGALASWV